MEYIRFSPSEKIYGERAFLESEAIILDIIQRKSSYLESRKKELLFRIDVKTKIDEALLLLADLDKKLPKVSLDKSQDFKEKEKESLSIEQELNKIKEKLEALKQ